MAGPDAVVKTLVYGVVTAGITLSLLAALAAGLDASGAVLLVIIFLLGALAVASTIRAGRGEASPDRCGACGALRSSHAPSCIQCGARARG